MKQGLTDSERSDIIKYRLEKAHSALEEAAENAERLRFNVAVNRLNYTCYYAISALLIADGQQTVTHKGIKSQFNLRYIRTGDMEFEHSKTFQRLFDARQNGDYEDFFENTSEDYLTLAPDACNLIKAVECKLKNAYSL